MFLVFVVFMSSLLLLEAQLVDHKLESRNSRKNVQINDIKRSKRKLRHRRCGWKNNANQMRVCPKGDTACGTWANRCAT